jgi:hypothetical protein
MQTIKLNIVLTFSSKEIERDSLIFTKITFGQTVRKCFGLKRVTCGFYCKVRVGREKESEREGVGEEAGQIQKSTENGSVHRRGFFTLKKFRKPKFEYKKKRKMKPNRTQKKTNEMFENIVMIDRK